MALTLGTLWDRLLLVVEAQGFVRANSPFDFEQQPDTKLDRVYHTISERVATDPYIGGDQGQAHRFTFYLAIRTKRDGWGSARQLLADLEALEAAMLADETGAGTGAEYYIHDDPGPTHELRQPVGSDYVIGRLELVAEFDRSP